MSSLSPHSTRHLTSLHLPMLSFLDFEGNASKYIDKTIQIHRFLLVCSVGLDQNWGDCFWWGRERGGAPPTLAVILMDDADYGRLWEGLPPPMDHQQANQLTTQPPSLGINPQTWWESISGSPPHKSISLFSRTRRFSTEASLPCEQSPLLPQPPRFYLHLARNSRFPSRLNLLLSFSRSSVGISPCGWFRKGWIKYSWQRREAETFQKSQFVRQEMKTHFQQKK